ncbi:carbon-nitrogen hydrolase family protein [Eubacterium sp. 1001713B170207_170306_E7]|uniref:carbon-nitrogen hydrolase family protein n=1 Tax=Eubacterium sp. 1001713B170207_170306_E7 TaxID=2787097 RepID=UPI00189A019C|nr:carbon-nitrogen hydrolase family protein [Eubacterium sp. 1001713B170207_170306_E7]
MKMKLACCQMPLTADKENNLNTAEKMVRAAVKDGAEMVLLPEMYTCPYAGSDFVAAAEPADGPANARMAALARELSITLFAGSIPEKEDGHIYNSCFVFGPDGSLLGRHRKVHLFDVDVKNGISFKESNVLTAGDTLTVVDTSFGPVGVAVCFDVRFPEQFRIMADRGARLVVLPAAFNMTTGPMHWELALRSRAVDNQLYLAACSSARDMNAKYFSWGHSCIVDPWGRIAAGLDEKPGTVSAEIDTRVVTEAREQLPILSARRADLYRLEELK